jgi:hypothetical protein
MEPQRHRIKALQAIRKSSPLIATAIKGTKKTREIRERGETRETRETREND